MAFLSKVRHLLHKHDIRPRKGLGQNFCVDKDVLRRMVGYSGLCKDDVVLEVGAGLGFLTKLLSETAKIVVAVEVDPRLVMVLREELRDRENVELIEGDVLKTKLPVFNKVVANPPYSISTPLIFRLLETSFESAVLTLQREVAERLVAQEGSRDYGRLTVMTNYRTDAEVLEYLSRRTFYPPPEVESAIVRIKPREKAFKILDEETFSDVVGGLFTQRRRKTKNAMFSFVRSKGYKKNEARILIKGLPHLEARVYTLALGSLVEISNEVHRRIIKSKKIFYGNHTFYVLPEVYEPSDDTFLLADNLMIERGSEVLDVGAGCGILSVVAAKNAGRVVATDLNPQAVECAEINVKLNGLLGKIEVRHGSLFKTVKPSEKFDVIIFNPPYLPTSEAEARQGWLEKAWAGGPTGREIVDVFLKEAPKHLKRPGKILLVQSTLSDVTRTVRLLKEYGLEPKILAEKKLDFESIKLIQAFART